MKGRMRTILKAVALVLAAVILVNVPMEAAAKGKRYLKDVYTSDSYYKDVKYCNERYIFGEKLGKRDTLNPEKIIDKGKFIDYVYNMYYDPIQDAKRRGFQMYGDAYPANRTYNNGSSSNYGSGYWYGQNTVYDRNGVAYTWDASAQRYKSASGAYYVDDGYYSSRNRRSRDYDAAWRWAIDCGIISETEDPSDTAKCTWGYRICDNLGYYIDGGGASFSHKKASKMHKYDACRILHMFCAKTRYDVDDIGRRTYYR